MVSKRRDGGLTDGLSGAAAIVTATWLETAATQLWARRGDVVRAGIALSRLDDTTLPAVAVSCGLAGGLDPRLRRGDVVIPDFVVDEGGRRVDCDPDLTVRLRAAAGALGCRPWRGGLLTSRHLVVGAARREATVGGLSAVDMEAALLAGRAARVAAVKIVLDTADEDLSAEWGEPARALLNPRRWREVVALALSAPLLASRAGRIAAAATYQRPRSSVTQR